MSFRSFIGISDKVLSEQYSTSLKLESTGKQHGNTVNTLSDSLQPYLIEV